MVKPGLPYNPTFLSVRSLATNYRLVLFYVYNSCIISCNLIHFQMTRHRAATCNINSDEIVTPAHTDIKCRSLHHAVATSPVSSYPLPPHLLENKSTPDQHSTPNFSDPPPNVLLSDLIEEVSPQKKPKKIYNNHPSHKF